MERTSDVPSRDGLSSCGLSDLLVGAPPRTDGLLPPGARLGDVTIVRFIAAGGMGQVYEGLQGMPCRTVAVKLVRAGVVSPAALKRFAYEAQVLGRLNHPGIARIYAMGVERLDGRDLPYFVMEYVADALPLVEHARVRNLTIRDRVALFRDVCRAVAHGHQRGVIHRDLKPGNILVDAEGTPHIIDFGVARTIETDAALPTVHTDFGQLLGTLPYMSPEQVAGVTAEIDTRADVYALGVVLHELLTGRIPCALDRQPIYEAARIIREVVPPPLGKVDPRLRGDMETIVATCLEKNPAARYSSAAELEAELGRWSAGEPIVASPPRLSAALGRIARRHWLAALAVVVSLAMLISGTAAVWIFALRASRERAVAVREQTRADAEARAARKQTYIANLRSLQACLANRNLRMGRQLFAENRQFVGNPLPLEMHLLGADLDESLVVLDQQRAVNHLAYSPDGRWLVATGPGPAVTRVPISRTMGSPLRSTWRQPLAFTISHGHAYAAAPPPDDDWLHAWRMQAGIAATGPEASPPVLARSIDGRHRVVHAADGSVCILDREAPGTDVLVEGLRGRIATAALSLDATRLAIRSQAGGLGLWDVATGRLIARLARDGEPIAPIQFSPDGSRLAVLHAPLRDRPGTIDLHAAGTGRRLCTVTHASRNFAARPLLAFSPDGARVVTATGPETACVWDTSSAGKLAELPGPATGLTALAVSPDGRRVAGGVSKGTVRLWDLEAGPSSRDFLGHDDLIVDLAFSPCGESLAASDAAGGVRIWGTTVTAPLAVLPGVRGLAASVFSPCGRWLAIAAGEDGGVSLWDPRTVTRRHSFSGPGGGVSSLAISPDGELVAAACGLPTGDGRVHVWATATGATVADLENVPRGPRLLAFSPDGRRLLATGADGMAAVWDLQTGNRLMASARAHDVPPRDLPTRVGAVFCRGGSRVAGVPPFLLDSETGAPVAALAPQRNLTSIASSPDGGLVGVGVAAGTVRLIDAATGRRLCSLIGHVSAVHALAFDATGTRIVTGGADGTARLWNTGTGAALAVLTGHDGAVEHCLVTGDGRRIVTVASDGTIRIWDMDGGGELCMLAGERHSARAVAVAPSGTALVAAAPDGTVRIWGPSNAAIVRARQAVTSPR